MSVQEWRYKFLGAYEEQWICTRCGHITKFKKRKCPYCGANMEYRAVKK